MKKMHGAEKHQCLALFGQDFLFHHCCDGGIAVQHHLRLLFDPPPIKWRVSCENPKLHILVEAFRLSGGPTETASRKSLKRCTLVALCFSKLVEPQKCHIRTSYVSVQNRLI